MAKNLCKKSLKKNYLLTIIVPVYELLPEYVRDNVRSFEKQKKFFSQFEVLFVNDGSGNETAETLKYETQKVSFNFRIINKKNENWGSCVNVGHQLGRGEYFCVVDGDDFVGSNFVQNIVETIQKEFFPKNVIFSYATEWINKDYKRIHLCEGKVAKLNLLEDKLVYPFVTRGSYVYPKEMIKGLLLPTGIPLMDKALLIWILNKARFVQRISAKYVWRYQRPKSTTTVIIKWPNYFKIIKKYGDFLKGVTCTNPYTKSLKWSNNISILCFKRMMKREMYNFYKKVCIKNGKNFKQNSKIILRHRWARILFKLMPSRIFVFIVVILRKHSAKIPYFNFRKGGMSFATNSKCEIHNWRV